MFATLSYTYYKYKPMHLIHDGNSKTPHWQVLWGTENGSCIAPEPLFLTHMSVI